MISKVQQQQIEWRRDRILELLASGFKQSEIARTLQINKSVIGRDIAYLKQRAISHHRTHIEERIPEQYQRCKTGYEIVLRRSWEIANNPNSRTSEVLESLKLFSDTHTKLNELSADDKTINQAINWIEKKKEVLLQLEQEKEQEQEQEGVF